MRHAPAAGCRSRTRRCRPVCLRTGAVLFSDEFSGVISGASPYALTRWNPLASLRKPSSSHAVRSASPSPVRGRGPLPSTIAAFDYRHQTARSRFPARSADSSFECRKVPLPRGVCPRFCGSTPRRKTGRSGPGPTGPFPPDKWVPPFSTSRTPPQGHTHPRRAWLRHNHPQLPSHE